MEIDGQVSATRGGRMASPEPDEHAARRGGFRGDDRMEIDGAAFLHNARRDRGVASRRSSGAIIRGNDQMEMDDS